MNKHLSTQKKGIKYKDGLSLLKNLGVSAQNQIFNLCKSHFYILEQKKADENFLIK